MRKKTKVAMLGAYGEKPKNKMEGKVEQAERNKRSHCLPKSESQFGKPNDWK